MTYDKGTKTMLWRKKSIQNMLLAYIHMPKMEFDPYFVLYTQKK